MVQPRFKHAATCFLMAVAASAFAAAQPPPSTPPRPAPAQPVQRGFPDPSESARRIGAAEARQALAKGEAVLVDVRPKEAYDAEHAQGAILIPLGEVAARSGELPQDKLIITYCT